MSSRVARVCVCIVWSVVVCVDARPAARSRRALRRPMCRLTQPVPRHRVLPEGQPAGQGSPLLYSVGRYSLKNATFSVYHVDAAVQDKTSL